MQLNPEQIPVGSIVEYNLGDHDSPDWIPTILDYQDIRWLTNKPNDFNSWHRPIPLTEKILTEWCNAEYSHRIRGKSFYRLWDVFVCFEGKYITVYVYNETPCCKLEYLHHLQLLYLALTQTPLPIQIK